jgi:hypothetical protein
MSERRRGRPPMKAGEAKRASFNTRLRDSLRDALEAAATDSGRSLSEEVEFRLERSIHSVEALADASRMAYGPQGAALLRIIGDLMRHEVFRAGLRMESDWLSNPAVFDRTSASIALVLKALRPLGEPGSAAKPRESAAGNLLFELGDEDTRQPNARWASSLRAELGPSADRIIEWRKRHIEGGNLDAETLP